jgi:hypothetical protein
MFAQPALFCSACRVACHYGDTEQQLTSTLTISSGAVFNRVMLFMLKEADGIFRRMLGLPQDASSAAAGETPNVMPLTQGLLLWGSVCAELFAASFSSWCPSRRSRLNTPCNQSSFIAAGAGDAAAAGATGAAGGGQPGVLLAEHVPKAPRWRKVRVMLFLL